MSFVSSKGNILCRLIKIELYKIFVIINRAIKGLHCIKRSCFVAWQHLKPCNWLQYISYLWVSVCKIDKLYHLEFYASHQLMDIQLFFLAAVFSCSKTSSNILQNHCKRDENSKTRCMFLHQRTRPCYQVKCLFLFQRCIAHWYKRCCQIITGRWYMSIFHDLS